MKTLQTFPSKLAIALSLALLASSGTAMAATTTTTTGAAIDAKSLPEAARAELRTEIERARAATPELFKAVNDIARRAKELDAQARAPGIPLTMHFKPLGNRALYPMLDLLVFQTPVHDLPPTADDALRLGLIEAVGAIRDPKATVVLSTILDEARDNRTVRAAAEGLSRIGTDESIRLVTQAATKAHADRPERERAILGGMHDARREAAARFLQKRLDEELDHDLETAKVIIKSLGGVGNAWAWKTMSDTREEASTRAIAAEALIDAFVRARGEPRDQAAKALLLVDAPNTPALIAKAKSKSTDASFQKELDGLSAKLAKNPAR